MKTKRKTYLQKFCIRMIGTAFFVLAAGLTGCSSREARFLEDAGGLQDSISPTEAAPGEETAQGAAEDETEPGETDFPSGEEEFLPAMIYVDVCGAVEHPGVYCLPEGSRVFQAIGEAGGFSPEADENYTNRAGLLADGQQIYIPTREEVRETGLPALAQSEEKRTGEGTDTKVNLNTADESQLMTLTGIGASRAQAIIAYRSEHGGFSAVEEIMNVQGIKEGTFAKIKDDIVV